MYGKWTIYEREYQNIKNTKANILRQPVQYSALLTLIGVLLRQGVDRGTEKF